MAPDAGRHGPSGRGVSLKVIADRLGLSVATVSRVLNGYPDGSPATRERVLTTASEMGYVPNSSARRLVSGRTDAVGVVLPLPYTEFADPFFVELIGGLSEVFHRSGLDLLVTTASPGDGEVAVYERLVASRKVDAFVIARTRRQDPRVAYLLEAKVPFVAHGRTERPTGFAWLDMDNERAMVEATAHLIRLGHRRIALIGAPDALNYAWQRRRGFETAMAAAGLAVDPRHLRIGDLTVTSGHRECEALLALAERPTAILAANDAMAIGALHALHERGLVPGEDVSVVGYDDISLAAFTHPPLTTTRQPIRAAARRLGEMLSALIAGTDPASLQEVWTTELVIRRSDGPPKAPRRGSALPVENILARAHAILRTNDRGAFTVPTSNGLYPAQWNWDSGFVALALAHLGQRARAWQEIESLLAAQWADGMVPHIVFHGDDASYFPNSRDWQAGEAIPSSGISQPPVLATFCRKILELEPGRDEQERLPVLLPKLFAYHRWYHTVRDPERTGLALIVHPWESGFDNNPIFDRPLRNVPLDGLEPYVRKDTRYAAPAERPIAPDYDGYVALLQRFRREGYGHQIARTSPFRLAEVGVNALLLRADRDLRVLALRGGAFDLLPEIDRWIQRTEESLERLWSDKLGLYATLDLNTGEAIELPSIIGLAPLFSGPLPVRRVLAMVQVIERWLDAMPFGLPSFDPAHPLFEPRRYCRGPAWFFWGWLVGQGLHQNGYADLERRIRRRCLDLARSRGLFEYYDPRDGSGCGGTEFSWTAAVTVLMAKDEETDRTWP